MFFFFFQAKDGMRVLVRSRGLGDVYKRQIELRIVPTAADFDPTVVQGVLTLIERCGGLAAKPQLGYGWIELVPGPSLDVGQFVSKVHSIASSQPGLSLIHI